MSWIEFTADGRPRSKGSRVDMVVPGTGRRRSAAVGEDDLRHWTRNLRSAATLEVQAARRVGQWPGELWAGGVLVVAEFRLVRPQRLMDEAGDVAATVVPDGDKLDRALWDALTGIVFADDRQVIAWAGAKRYASVFDSPGCTVRVATMDGQAATAWPDRVWEERS